MDYFYIRFHDMEFADDPEFQALIREYSSQFPSRRDEVLAALERGDFQAVAELAHKLAGCAAVYGFEELGRQARQCEQAIRNGGNELTCREQGQSFASELHRAIAASLAA